ncbi:Probable steroid-binding protein 3 [Linum perenne]
MASPSSLSISLRRRRLYSCRLASPCGRRTSTPWRSCQYNDIDSSKLIYVEIRGRMFDVTTDNYFYGLGGSYSMFAGKDSSRTLAKMSKNDVDVVPSLQGLAE